MGWWWYCFGLWFIFGSFGKSVTIFRVPILKWSLMWRCSIRVELFLKVGSWLGLGWRWRFLLFYLNIYWVFCICGLRLYFFRLYVVWRGIILGCMYGKFDGYLSEMIKVFIFVLILIESLFLKMILFWLSVFILSFILG